MTKLLLPYGSARYLGTMTGSGSVRSNQVTKLGIPKCDLITKVGNVKIKKPGNVQVTRLR